MKSHNHPFVLSLIVISILSVILSCADNDKMFTLIPSNRSGVKFKNILKETEQFNVFEYYYLYHGGGVAVGDINNDGFPDLYFTGNMVGSHLYLNKGDFKFDEIAKEAGVFAEGLWNTGATMADVNGDGLLDIYVCRSAAPDPVKRKNLLFINNGPSAGSEKVTFTEKGMEYGVADSGYSTQAAFFDYDRDGDLDLYVLNHSIQEYAGFNQITPSLKKRKNEAYSDKLYRNDNGKFKNVSEEAGLVSNVLGFGLGIAVSDINNDGWPDMYVSNDYNEQDYLYLNNKNGTFTECLAMYMGHVPLFSMGSDIADINNDGYTDIMVLDMLPESNYRQKMVAGPDNYDKYQLLAKSGFHNQTMRNMLQLNNQGKSFSEIGQFSGVSNTDWSWGPLFADLDNDGLKDIYITNGYKTDFTNMDFINYAVQEKLEENKTGKPTSMMELLQRVPAIIEENYTYRNNGDLTFEKTGAQWGLDQKSLSNGAAYADFDNDGDLDLVVNNIGEEAFVYRNNCGDRTENHYLKVKLKGEGLNTFGIGAKITLTLAANVLVQEMFPTRGYQSSVDYNLVFGLGSADTIDQLNIIWSDGKTQTIANIAANQTLVLHQKDASPENEKESFPSPTLFTDITADSLLDHTHIENRFIDFKREGLLPHKLSTQGPKMAKADVNNDGLEDIFIGGAKGHPGKLFLQTQTGEFTGRSEKTFADDAPSEDIGTLFFDADGDNDFDLYVVSGGNDFETNAPELQDRLYFNDGLGNFKKRKASLPSMSFSGSCVTSGDIDGDGDQDLFVGGRLVPGQYPTAPHSFLLQNDGKGNFVDVTKAVHPDLADIGMVTDALWTDYDGDKKDDLILVGEWMGVRVFRNKSGQLEELTTDTGLENSEGWWNCIEQADFDGDGDMDYVLGNFGLNAQLKASPEQPVTLYAKDFDNNGSIDPIMCSYVMGESYPVFSKDDLTAQLVGLKSKYVNYSDYANEKITDIFSAEELKNATVLKAVNFSSCYLENLGNGKFDLRPLSDRAQFSPIYGLLIKDFDDDGHLDILLSGNFFGNRVKFGRYDADKGTVLKGDGKGNFTPLNTAQSGLNIDGEVRDIIWIERTDKTEIILFARNNDAVKTYKVQGN